MLIEQIKIIGVQKTDWKDNSRQPSSAQRSNFPRFLDRLFLETVFTLEFVPPQRCRWRPEDQTSTRQFARAAPRFDCCRASRRRHADTSRSDRHRPRPAGVVSAVSETIAAGGGNWLDTRMASFPANSPACFWWPLRRIKPTRSSHRCGNWKRKGCASSSRRAMNMRPSSAAPCDFELVGLDRPGIIRDISHVLAAQNVSIAELESERVSGAFSGEAMFKVKAG